MVYVLSNLLFRFHLCIQMTFTLMVMLYQCKIKLVWVGWLVGGWVAGSAENITNSAPN